MKNEKEVKWYDGIEQITNVRDGIKIVSFCIPNSHQERKLYTFDVTHNSDVAVLLDIIDGLFMEIKNEG